MAIRTNESVSHQMNPARPNSMDAMPLVMEQASPAVGLNSALPHAR